MNRMGPNSPRKPGTSAIADFTFLQKYKFPVGSEIEFVITLPEQVTQSGDVNIRCLGQIVRVEPTSNGRMGIAAKIERYEFMPATATAA